MFTLSIPPKKSYMPTIQTIPLSVHCTSVHSFSRDFLLDFRAGVANVNPQFWGRGGRRGSGMVQFDRALVSFYRLSIVSFPLCLRISQILPLLFSSKALFPYPLLFGLKFRGVPFGVDP